MGSLMHQLCLGLREGALLPQEGSRPHRFSSRCGRMHCRNQWRTNFSVVDLFAEPRPLLRPSSRKLCIDPYPKQSVTKGRGLRDGGHIAPLSVDVTEGPLLRATKSSIAPSQHRFGGDDYFSLIRKAAESSTNVFQQLLPPRLIEGDRFNTLVKLAIIAAVIGLQACYPAWGAGTEIAKAKVDSGVFGDLDDIQNGFASSFLLIFFSEIGDKTFFIAALLATRKPGAAVFSGTFGALAVMTVISVALGRAFHYVDELLPSLGDRRIPWDDLAAVILLVYFGVSTLIEAASMEDSKQEEEQQEAELAIAGVGASGAVAGTVAATFALVFVAEWGDKSFFSTIALAAASSPLGVVTGAIAGHGAATLLAVLGGSFLANYISEKAIAYVGGALFIVFAGITLVETLT